LEALFLGNEKIRYFKTYRGIWKHLRGESSVGSRWREGSAIAVVLRRVTA
jgi:hypothetical protein